MTVPMAPETRVVTMRADAWYGDRPLTLPFPSDWDVCVHRPDTPPPLTPLELADAIAHPVGRPPLRELARGRRRPIIIVDDLTRPTPAHHVVPLLLDELAAAGIDAASTTVISATGTHGALPTELLARKIGERAARTCRLVGHDDRRDTVYLGRTARGTPVHVNRAVAESDLVLGVGGIYPQHSTGFGGGAKLALGVLGRRSITALHYGHHSVEGSYDVANEFRRDLDDVAALVRLEFSVATHVDGDRRIVRAVAGDPIRYFADEVAFALRTFTVPGPGDADVVVANAYPIDVSLTFMRSKGVIPLLAARPGASRVLVAACPQGVGHHGLFPFVDAPRFPRAVRLWRTARARPDVLAPRLVEAARRRINHPPRPRLGATAGGAPPSRGICLYTAETATTRLPARIPGMTAVAHWPAVLSRLVAEQAEVAVPRVVVYPCAPIEVLS